MKFEQKYSDKVIERGEEYLDSVEHCIKINNSIYGQVQGSTKYKTEVDLDSFDGDCSCPYETNCKHAVALYYVYKKGKFWDAEDFVKSLDKMNHYELKEMILSKLQDNLDWVKKHTLRKNINKADFFKSFKKKFSFELIDEAQAILPDLSFEQLLELHSYISKNYDDLAEKLLEEDGDDFRYSYEYDNYDDEDYDEELSDLADEIIELIVKRALSENKAEKILNKETLRDEIIKNVDDESKETLYENLEEKTALIKEIAKFINDKTLLFSIAVYENNLKSIIDNFDFFEDAIKKHSDIIDNLSDVVDLFSKNKVINKEIAKKLLNRHIGGKYNKKQLDYLVSQINDFEFIRKNFNKDHMETDVALLERLAQIDNEKTLNFIKNKKDLLGRHWSNIVPLFSFLKKHYSKQIIEKYIEENQNTFRTSSHLKKHLKDECGIFISQREGNLTVEVRNE